MDRQQTYNHLKSHNSGAYLIRPASRKGFIVISCRVNNEVKHALLNTNSPDFNEICNPNITTVEMQDLIAKQFNIENTFPSITENKMSPLLLSFQSENAKEIVYQYSKLIDASEMNVEDDQKGSSNALRIYV